MSHKRVYAHATEPDEDVLPRDPGEFDRHRDANEMLVDHRYRGVDLIAILEIRP